MTCANCNQDAVFWVDDPGANPLGYCRACLPRNLRERAAAGAFPLPEDE